MRISDWSSDVCSSDLNTIVRAIALALSCGLIAGCAAPAANQASRVDNAVFFTDAKLLHPVPGTPGLSRYVSPQFAAQRQRITGLYLVPIEVLPAPDSPYKGMTATDVAALTTAFRQEFLKDPSPRYPLVIRKSRGSGKGGAI